MEHVAWSMLYVPCFMTVLRRVQKAPLKRRIQDKSSRLEYPQMPSLEECRCRYHQVQGHKYTRKARKYISCRLVNCELSLIRTIVSYHTGSATMRELIALLVYGMLFQNIKAFNCMEIKTILDLVKEYNPRSDQDMIQLAFEFASEAHKGQRRHNGEEYIQHCLSATYHLARIKMDDATIIAGLLHDVPDETSVSLDEVRKQFGDEVCGLVEGVTRLGKLKYRGMERYAENLRKMFVSIAHDIRIIILKFADRLHNLETLDALPADKQLRIAHEVLEIYAPIAHRLGIGYVKERLEDHAFKYVYPEEYRTITELAQPKLEQKELYLGKLKAMLAQIFEENSITPLAMESRVKHFYSIYRKSVKKNTPDLQGIYDLVAMRVIVNSIAECYTILGILHQYFKPLQGRFKDYIAQPRQNNYRSLHTTVFCEENEIVEFQIRTPQMDYEAKYGIAAHWNYDESNKSSQKITKNLDWLHEIVSIQSSDSYNHEEFLQTLNLDIFQNRIFVFTPKGDVINLPEGSTPIDFAYHIHSDIGRKCSGARINDMLASLNTKLNSGDVVYILTERNRKRPNSDWLSFVKTHMAKTRIKAQLREENP